MQVLNPIHFHLTLDALQKERAHLKRTISLIVPLLFAIVSLSHGEVFHKTKVIDAKGKEVPVDIDFDKGRQSLMVKPTDKKAAENLTDVPYGSIEKLSYELSSRHRVKEGAVVMIASLGAGAVVMLTKSKNHWFYVDYKEQDGTVKSLTLKLDKGEYEKVLKAAREQTGKEVEKLAAQKSGAADAKK